MRRALLLLIAAGLATACAGPLRRAEPPPAQAAPAPAAFPSRGIGCHPTSAQRCDDGRCEEANEGLHAEAFDLDVALGTVGACLYTDCYAGPAQVVLEEGAPWRVTLLGVVRSERPEDAVPPPGSPPFPLTITVDLRDGRFTATWAHGPGGLQVDFGTCALRGP